MSDDHAHLALRSTPDPTAPSDPTHTTDLVTDHDDLRARLQALDAAADRYLEDGRVAGTREAYAQDWAAWTDYTRWAGIPLLSGGRGALVGFVLWLENGAPRLDRPAGTPAAPATIRRRIAGALHGLRRFGADLDPRGPEAAREALAVYRRRLAEDGIRRGRGQAVAVDLAAVLAMSKACPDTNAGRRDRAMLTIGFYGATRASDQAHLRAGDVTVEQNGLVLDVRVGKTTGRSALPRRRHPLLCPRTAWLAWRRVCAGSGPAFRRVDRHDVVSDRPLSPDAVTAVISRAGERAGLSHPVTCHSLRAGFATESYRAGAALLDIARQGRWAPGSQELFRYIRTVDQWRTNAADPLDLPP
ncbi:tyrosine-type recombinase/integrase [Pseudonocardia sp. WMMC193]|uniref:tyrosine-type recombinase/integrase n=1 Tax=Pseudonocardia sp. WMMC193 TaxID=2911965 RepID=UPI001F02306A|nr:tyrosine-type recombinase/integrase [Pseudonocardia sp. WMMC193]MCF7548990.1 tyrosine-type recombinase/integrase [Pseudonocardia sp. WMMC193]